MVLGVGLNVALEPLELPRELHGIAGTLGRKPGEIEPTLERLLAGLGRWLHADAAAVLHAFAKRDLLNGRTVAWADGVGEASGLDERGRLVVRTAGGSVALESGEVHLRRPDAC